MTQDRWQAGARWLRSVQNSDGGWGELPRSYDDPSFKGQGPTTPSQTAWALLCLMTAGDYQSVSVRRGIDYLLCSSATMDPGKTDIGQELDFPKVFYLRYHLYAPYFPLLALDVLDFDKDDILSMRFPLYIMLDSITLVERDRGNVVSDV